MTIIPKSIRVKIDFRRIGLMPVNHTEPVGQARVSEHYLVSASGTHSTSAAGPFLTIDGSARVTGDSDLTVAALLALGTISYQKVYERKEFLVCGGWI